MPPAIDIARAESIFGWMSRAELLWLADHARAAQAVIEIGSFLGRSTRALADHCRGQVYAVDPWDGYLNDDDTQAKWITKAGGGSWPTIRAAFEDHLVDHIATGRVVPVALPSTTAIARFAGMAVDLVFIDGDHRYDACKRDIELYAPHVRPGGILAGHDYSHKSWPGVARAVDELLGPAVERCGTIWWRRR